MLRLHTTVGDVILFGLVMEATEYARYADQGNKNEHSHFLGGIDRNGCNGQFGLHRHGQLLIRSRRALRKLQQRTDRSRSPSDGDTVYTTLRGGARAVSFDTSIPVPTGAVRTPKKLFPAELVWS
jgi:hypothetical protein